MKSSVATSTLSVAAWRFLRRDKKAMVGSIILFILLVICGVPQLVHPRRPGRRDLQPGVGPLVGAPAGHHVLRPGRLLAVDGGHAPVGDDRPRRGIPLHRLLGRRRHHRGVLGWTRRRRACRCITDVILVIPTFPLIIVIAAYTKSASFWTIVFVLVVTGWSYGARQLRVQALSLRNRDYLLAARARGESSWYIIGVELIPPMTSLIVANFLGAALYAVLAAAGLQFVGLGNVNTESWGTMLYWAQNNEALSAGLPLWALAPGIMIAILGSALALLNYAFDEVSNPALAPGGEPTAIERRWREHADPRSPRPQGRVHHRRRARPRPWRASRSTSRRVSSWPSWASRAVASRRCSSRSPNC